MERKLQNKLLELQSEGFTIMISSGPFVDSDWSLTAVGDDITSEGEVVYDSQVYSGRSLDEVPEHEVTVLQPLENWQTHGDVEERWVITEPLPEMYGTPRIFFIKTVRGITGLSLRVVGPLVTAAQRQRGCVIARTIALANKHVELIDAIENVDKDLSHTEYTHQKDLAVNKLKLELGV
ncbi:hypothetical protein VPHK469_0170 [Vibrio phage K469]